MEFIPGLLACWGHYSIGWRSYSVIFFILYGLNDIKKIMKDFNLFEIKTHLIPSSPHELRTKRTRPKLALRGQILLAC
jgi:hypothetical protein